MLSRSQPHSARNRPDTCGSFASFALHLRNPSPPRKMFKRVEKKLAKKKKEKELGITEEIREAIGLNDVDSDSSSSHDSEDSSSTASPRIQSQRKRLLDDDEPDATSDVSSEKQALGASDDAEDDEDEDEPGVQMTVEEALHNPLFIISIQPDIRGCIVCPRKLLKNDIMASVHTSSQVCRGTSPQSLWGPHDVCFSSFRQAHRRRISKFKEAAASAKPDDDARNVLSVAFVSTPLQPKLDSDDPAPLSNRAAKRVSVGSRPYSTLNFYAFAPLTCMTSSIDRQVGEGENQASETQRNKSTGKSGEEPRVRDERRCSNGRASKKETEIGPLSVPRGVGGAAPPVYRKTVRRSARQKPTAQVIKSVPCSRRKDEFKTRAGWEREETKRGDELFRTPISRRTTNDADSFPAEVLTAPVTNTHRFA